MECPLEFDNLQWLYWSVIVWNLAWSIVIVIPLLVDVPRAKFAIANTLWLLIVPGLLQVLDRLLDWTCAYLQATTAAMTICLVTCSWRNVQLLNAAVAVFVSGHHRCYSYYRSLMHFCTLWHSRTRWSSGRVAITRRSSAPARRKVRVA